MDFGCEKVSPLTSEHDQHKTNLHHGLFLHYSDNILAYHAKLFYFNFQPLEVVSRCRDPQLQVALS